MYPYRRQASQNSVNRRCSRVSTNGGGLFVPVSLEGGCCRVFCLVCCWWLIVLLRDFSALQVKQRIHGGLAVPEDATQFPPSPVSGAENITERDGFTRKFSTNGAAQKLVVVEDADFRHVPRIKPQSDRFPNVCRQCC